MNRFYEGTEQDCSETVPLLGKFKIIGYSSRGFLSI